MAFNLVAGLVELFVGGLHFQGKSRLDHIQILAECFFIALGWFCRIRCVDVRRMIVGWCSRIVAGKVEILGC